MAPTNRVTGDSSDATTRARPGGRRAARTGPAFEAGTTLGRWTLRRRIGAGGQAEVWEAEEGASGRRLALKILSGLADASAESVTRFEKEGRLAASISHPHVVYVVAAEDVDGLPVIAMELMDGGTVADLLAREGRLDAQRAVAITLDLLDGLEAAAASGIVHRDVKPSNCFLDADGRARIGDFGISKSLELAARLTATGSFIGTPAYASPEQIRGRDVDVRSDIYSLGATLYTMLTGRPPHEGANGGDLLARIVSEEPKALAHHGVKLPRAFQRVVLRMLDRDPARRFQDHAAVRAALAPFGPRPAEAAPLGDRGLAYILDSVLVAAAALLLVLVAEVTFGQVSRIAAWLMVAAFDVGWFALFDASRSGSPGKRLLGLRVTTLDGGRCTLARAALRAATWLLPFHVPLVLSVATDGAFPPLAAVLFWGAYGWPLCRVVTMRASNRYAGLHELASGTRVVAPGRARMRAPEASWGALARLPSTLPEARPVTMPARGAFAIEGEVWVDGSRRLLLGRDVRLDRKVLILETPASWPDPEAASDRTARLRRLGSGEQGGERWTAWEAPSGTSLRAFAAARGPIGWGDARRVLYQLARELEASDAVGDLPDELSLDHLWLDGFGNLRLLPFPLLPPSERSLALRGDDRFLLFRQVLFLLLSGQTLPPDLLSGRRLGVPVPEHARSIVEHACRAPPAPATLRELAERLLDCAERPASVSRWARLGLLARVAAPAATLSGLAAIRLATAHEDRGLAALGIVMTFALMVLMVQAMLSILAALVGFSPLLQDSGLAVQRRDGAEATAGRRVMRAAVAFAPTLAATALFCVIALPAVRDGFRDSLAASRSDRERAEELEQRRAQGQRIGRQARGVVLGAEAPASAPSESPAPAGVEPRDLPPDGSPVEPVRPDNRDEEALLALALMALLAIQAIGALHAALWPRHALHDRLSGTTLVMR